MSTQVISKKCRCCCIEYDHGGREGGFCSISCKKIHYINYVRALKDAYREVYRKFYGG